MNHRNDFLSWCSERIKERNAGWVYFFGQVTEVGGYVKIGYAKDIRSRWTKFHTDNFNGELLVTIEGTPSLEKMIHRRFADVRERGEWFRFDGELAEILKSFAAQSTAMGREICYQITGAAPCH